MPGRSGLLLLAVLTLVMWGLWGFFGKVALERRMTPMALFVAETAACLVLSVGLIVVEGGRVLPTGGSWNRYGLLSAAVMTVGMVFYYFALDRGPASVVVPLTSIYPAVTVLLSYAFLKERLEPTQWVGLALILVGVYLLLADPLRLGAK